MIIQPGFTAQTVSSLTASEAPQAPQPSGVSSETARPVSAPSETAAQQTQAQRQTEERRNNEQRKDVSADRSATGRTLSEEERKQLEELKQRDREVRQHELAHKAAAGRHATGAISLDQERGPDGRLYARGGEVSIDTSKVPDDPQATLDKAQTIKRAAMAPQDPSSQDYQVAAQASQMEAEARRELAEQQQETRESGAMEPTSAAAREGSRTFGLNQITTNGLAATVGNQLDVFA